MRLQKMIELFTLLELLEKAKQKADQNRDVNFSKFCNETINETKKLIVNFESDMMEKTTNEFNSQSEPQKGKAKTSSSRG